MKGIDVSNYQGNIDWEKVKASGIQFVILRGGYIGNEASVKDTKFDEYYRRCKEIKMPVGVYFYNYAQSVSRISHEISWCKEVLKDKQFELPIYIDMEEGKTTYLGKTILTEIATKFCELITQAGYRGGVYANLNWYKNYLDAEKIKKMGYSRWIAHYGVDENKYRDSYDIMQYSSSGTVQGINGRVDMDILYNEGLINGIVPVKDYTYTDFVKEIQIAEGQTGKWVDGIAGAKTLALTPTLSRVKNRTHKAVLPVQKYLYALGYTEVGVADGIAGAKFDTAVKRYQRENGCVSDGEITARAKTWQKLLKLI